MSLFLQRLTEIRSMLERAFAPDTAAPGSKPHPRSSGHCAAVAVIVQRLFGGEYMSAVIEGQSHWFNRVFLCLEPIDVDLTGDQFGKAAIQVSKVVGGGPLYRDERIRKPEELRQETIERAELLARRAGLDLPPPPGGPWPKEVQTSAGLAWVGPPPSGLCPVGDCVPHRWVRAVSVSGWECVSCCAPRPVVATP